MKYQMWLTGLLLVVIGGADAAVQGASADAGQIYGGTLNQCRTELSLPEAPGHPVVSAAGKGTEQ
ncbi:hypothetical protein AAB59_16975 [Salmonella enterica subsp. enterica serovar Typhimurium]|nr:hypothetical protein [Salmonella enterica subsp. enterica serovar Kottbus]ECV8848550.1 hypothetical protein [Salmonella enterica subsp. enterica serovar Typhimurium]